MRGVVPRWAPGVVEGAPLDAVSTREPCGAAGSARAGRSWDRPHVRAARCAHRRSWDLLGLPAPSPENRRLAKRKRSRTSAAGLRREATAVAAVLALGRPASEFPAPPDTSTCGCCRD